VGLSAQDAVINMSVRVIDMVVVICCGKKFKIGKKTYMCDLPKGHETSVPLSVMRTSRHSCLLLRINISDDGGIFVDVVR